MIVIEVSRCVSRYLGPGLLLQVPDSVALYEQFVLRVVLGAAMFDINCAWSGLHCVCVVVVASAVRSDCTVKVEPLTREVIQSGSLHAQLTLHRLSK